MMKKLILKKFYKYLPVIIAVLVFISTRIAARNPGFVEKYYSDGVYPVIAVALSSISSIFSFSIWDLFWAAAILLLIAGIFLTIFRKIKPGIFFLRFIQGVSILYVWLYISWGYNYNPSIWHVSCKLNKQTIVFFYFITCILGD